ncbi:hypothetical protein [Prosthecobacter fluviatilis]|uniref:Uncharacterized protein n=1 Tax=Prosthecobacter fluviatilis TaxID=445931 RepID=A0ABW0KUR1_9BACT
MDADELREQIKASNRRVGLSFDEAAETTVFSSELLDQYLSLEYGDHGVAAFRIEAFLTAAKNRPIKASVLTSIADALRQRIAEGLKLSSSDLQMGLALAAAGHFKRDDMASLVQAMKGVNDFAVASAAAALLPIIGPDFIQDYLVSTELFETGGMGGPQRPLIQEMASEAMRDFKHQKALKSDCGSFGWLRRICRAFFPPGG